MITLNFDEEIDENLDEDLEDDKEEKPITSKTPAEKTPPKGNKINIYFMSTIGPGEKKQKLTINDGYLVSDIKETVGNLFGLNPLDFHLSSGGITLEENKAVNHYNLADSDDILIIPASIAGISNH